MTTEPRDFGGRPDGLEPVPGYEPETVICLTVCLKKAGHPPIRRPQVVASKDRPAGERFGRYTLLEPIGRGGMAEVFRAVAHGVEGFARVFVIKRILKEKSQSQDFIDMFVSEARVSALLNHPNIVQSYDFGQIGGSYFISMEYLRGKDLLLLMRQLRAARKSLDPAVAAYIAQQVATGLHYAHSLTGAQGKPLNIVHRDVSPSNIMLLRAGGVKLLDFGIAKVGESQRVEGDNSQDAFIKGKLSYLSPEQIRGDSIDGRSDVFSLGVCLWEMLTGRRLFFDKNEYNIMKNVLDRPVVPPSMHRMDSPTALDYIVVRALERDVSRRYRSAKEMAEELEGFLAESHFSPSSLPRVLDDLFGVDAGIFDAQMEAQLQVSASWSELRAVEGSSVTEAASNPLKTVPPLAVDGTGPETPRRRARTRGRALPWVFAGVLLAGAAVMAAERLRPQHAVDESPLPKTTLSTSVNAPQPPPAVVGEAAADTAVAAAEPTPLPLPMTIDLRLETQPTKAEILASDGRVLGTTPANLSLPRSNQPITLTLRRKGFANLVHAVVPDRDAQVVLSLYRQGAKRPPDPAMAQTGVRPAEAIAPKSDPPTAPETPAGEAQPEAAVEVPQAPPADVIEPLLPPSPQPAP